MSEEHGGAAFPLSPEGENWYQEGMSLRDWFAGMALPIAKLESDNGITANEIADRAYSIADAMLARRQ